MQYVVTDGRTFTDLQQRDTTYTRPCADRTGMACTVTSTARSGAYRLTNTYTTDPARDTVLIRTRLRGLTVPTGRLHLYVRLDPTVGGNGGGGSDNAGADSATADKSALLAWDTNTETAAVNRDYAVPTYLALRADRPFASASAGYAGTASDGLHQLDADHSVVTPYDSAPDGNVVVTAELRTEPGGGRNAHGHGHGHGQRSRRRRRSAGPSRARLRPYASERPRDRRRRRSTRSTAARSPRTSAAWRAYDAGLARPPHDVTGLSPRRAKRLARAYYLGANVVKASEDKQFPGAIVAGLASPWGQAVPRRQPAGRQGAVLRLLPGGVQPRPLRGVHRRCWSAATLRPHATQRASCSSASSWPTDGCRATASSTGKQRARHRWRPARRDRLPDPHGVAVGACARQRALHRAHSQGGRLRRRARAVVRLRAVGGAGRLLAVDDRGRDRGPRGCGPDRRRPRRDADRSLLYLATADHFQRSIKGWTVTTTGPYASGRYFIRLATTGDPNAAIVYNLGNGGPDADQRAVVDAGLPRADPPRRTPGKRPGRAGFAAGGRRRRSRAPPRAAGLLPLRHDPGRAPRTATATATCPDPTACSAERQAVAPPPDVNRGSGHLWPVLSGERAEQLLQTGDTAGAAALLLGHGPVFLRRRAGARAGVGEPGPARVAVRDRSGHRLDRLRARASGRLRLAADLGAGPGRCASPCPCAPGARSSSPRPCATVT